MPKKWWVIPRGKRKAKYSAHSRKQFHRKYKAMAEELATIAIQNNIHPFAMRRFVELPIRHRRYYFSLVRNRITKGVK